MDDHDLTGRDRPNSETRLLYRITAALRGIGEDVERVLEESIEHLAYYGFLRPTLAIYDQAHDEIRFEVSHGLSPHEQKKGRFRKDEGIEGRVFSDGQPAIVPSIGSEPDFIDRTGARSHVNRDETAFICVPISNSNGMRVGTLSADLVGREEGDLKWDRRLLTVVAQLLGETAGRWRDQMEEEDAFDEEQLDLAPVEDVGSRTMVGKAPAMRAAFRLVNQVAPSQLTVLIRGESGTGKEMIARAIHESSHRSTGPFVSLNCGALPETLVESELFGHVRGAFTGALQDRRGHIEMANGGTLFLDEIGDLPLPMQVKLLRVLQEGEIVRVGEDVSRRVDVRVLAATHTDLETMIDEGRFREDLFYRLNVFPIYVPGLRERRTDITLLANHFIEKHGRIQGKAVSRISTPAIDLMCAYHWPGNVRELENCIERAVLLATSGVIRHHHLPPTLQTAASSDTTNQGSLEDEVMAFERELLIDAMKNAHGNMAAASRALKTTPRILTYRLKKHALHRTLAVRRRREE